MLVVTVIEVQLQNGTNVRAREIAIYLCYTNKNYCSSVALEEVLSLSTRAVAREHRYSSTEMVLACYKEDGY